MVEVRVLRGIREVAEGEWNALLDGEAPPFLDHRWLAALEDAGCVRPEVGWMPVHLAAYEDGDLVAAAPAYLKGHSEGEFVFDWRFAEVAERLGVAYYPKLIVAVPFTPATGTRLLVAPGFDRARGARILGTAALELGKSAGASSVHVLFLREGEVGPLAELGFTERHGVQFQFHRDGASTFDDVLKRLPSKKRTQLRRERRMLAEQGIVVRTLADADYTAEAAKAMHRFYVTTVDKFMWGRRYLNPRFFELVASTFRDRLAWVFAERDGTPIAGAFNARGRDVLYGRYWGADVDVPMLHFNVCYYHGIDECLRHGYVRFEPGAGGEHKHARGFRPTITRSMHAIFDERLSGLMTRAFDDERTAIARHLTADADDD